MERVAGSSYLITLHALIPYSSLDSPSYLADKYYAECQEKSPCATRLVGRRFIILKKKSYLKPLPGKIE